MTAESESEEETKNRITVNQEASQRTMHTNEINR